MRKFVISITAIPLITIVLAINPAYSQKLSSSPNFQMHISILDNAAGSAKSGKFQLVSSTLGGLPVEPQTLSSSNFKLDNARSLNPIAPLAITLVDTDNNATAGSPKLIKANITFSASSVSAKLFYIAGGKTFSAFDMVAITAATSVTTGSSISGSAETVQTFSVSIPASAVTLSGLAYYIKAIDNLGQTAFYPPEAEADTKKSVALNVVGDISGPEVEVNFTFIPSSLPRWRSPEDWSLISFPFELPNADPQAVFADLGKVEEEWQAYRYEGGSDYARAIAIGNIGKFHSIQRGKAAWIYSVKGGSVTIKGAKATNPLALFPIQVKSGWNQVGSPFRFSRFWNKETIKFSTKADGLDAVDILQAATANMLTPTLYLRSGNDYLKVSADPNVKGSGLASFPGKVEAWQGYLILMKQDGYLWIDPTAQGPSLDLAPAAPVYADVAKAKGWMLEMNAGEQGSKGAGEKTIKTITVGMWEGAKEEEDNFDSPAAPFISAASEGLEFFIPHPEWNNPWAKNYEQDIRPYKENAYNAYNDNAKNSAYWEIEVGATGRSPLQADDSPSPITLTWKELYRVPDAYMLYLIDPAADQMENGKWRMENGEWKLVDLKKERSYTTYANKEGKKLYVVATIDGIGLPEFLAKLLIKKTIAYQNYPNPFNPETWIPYQLANSGSVSIRIYDVAGRLVRSLNLGRKEVGIYVSKDKAAYWDGRNDYGERVSSGIYFYELRAGRDFRAVKKMVILK